MSLEFDQIIADLLRQRAAPSDQGLREIWRSQGQPLPEAAQRALKPARGSILKDQLAFNPQLDPMTPEQAAVWERAHSGEPFEPGKWGRELRSDLASWVPKAGDTRDQNVYRVQQALLGVMGLPGTGASGTMAAVKQPGGFWHPEAVERLGEPVYENLRIGMGESFRDALRNRLEDYVSDPGKKGKETADLVGRMVRNYLNRQAGTTRDPLSGYVRNEAGQYVKNPEMEVRIPVGEGTKGWEEVTDKLVYSDPAKMFGTKGLEKVPPEEQVWHLGGAAVGEASWGRSREGEALQSQLSHVGDYLRQNVAPEKLQNYDLVRAVRETAANDARVAAAAAKELTAPNPWKIAQTNALPLHREYKGVTLPAREMKTRTKTGHWESGPMVKLPEETVDLSWRELKLPEKLTPEQAKGVKLTTSREGPSGIDTFIATDASGKPIKNNFTGENAIGSTPEEAWLSGRLAEEGNALGHCVGGYCADVASGGSKIFSLHDSKGRSYATVETRPGEDLIRTSALPEKEVHYRGPDNILQIKGPSNGALAPEMRPFIQDFLNSGKWGEVRDLGNTGLYRVRGKYSAADKYYTAEELKELNIDPQLLRPD